MGIHGRPPSRPEFSHGPYDYAACRGDDAHPCEQPTVADGIEQRLSDHAANTREDVSDKVVDRNAGGCLLRHEFCQHRGGRREYEHTANTEEEVGDQLCVPSLERDMTGSLRSAFRS